MFTYVPILKILSITISDRYRDPNSPILKQKTEDPNPAYQLAMEATNMEELEEIATNPDAVYMQSLLIRERILGPDHKVHMQVLNARN